MGSSPPVCSFTASLIQVAHVESRCATIIYMNGIENFLLRGREKKRERVRNGEMRREEKGREKGRTIEDTDKGERRREKERARRATERQSEGGLRGRAKEQRTERTKMFWNFMSVIT